MNNELLRVNRVQFFFKPLYEEGHCLKLINWPSHCVDFVHLWKGTERRRKKRNQSQGDSKLYLHYKRYLFFKRFQSICAHPVRIKIINQGLALIPLSSATDYNSVQSQGFNRWLNIHSRATQDQNFVFEAVRKTISNKTVNQNALEPAFSVFDPSYCTIYY